MPPAEFEPTIPASERLRPLGSARCVTCNNSTAHRQHIIIIIIIIIIKIVTSSQQLVSAIVNHQFSPKMIYCSRNMLL
jgi:hypothetical protein